MKDGIPAAAGGKTMRVRPHRLWEPPRSVIMIPKDLGMALVS